MIHPAELPVMLWLAPHFRGRQRGTIDFNYRPLFLFFFFLTISSHVTLQWWH